MDPNWGYHQGYDNWQQQRPPRYRGRGGGGWRPRPPSNDYYAPRQQRWQGHNQPRYLPPGYYQNQPQFHSGGRGQFRPPRPRFQSAQYGQYRGPPDADNIENWVSSEMWADPWALLMQQFEPNGTKHGNDVNGHPLTGSSSAKPLSRPVPDPSGENLEEDKEASLEIDKEARLGEDKEARLGEDKEASLEIDKEARLGEDKEARLGEDKEASLEEDKEASLVPSCDDRIAVQSLELVTPAPICDSLSKPKDMEFPEGTSLPEAASQEPTGQSISPAHNDDLPQSPPTTTSVPLPEEAFRDGVK